jgi:hypothetical protein
MRKDKNKNKKSTLDTLSLNLSNTQLSFALSPFPFFSAKKGSLVFPRSVKEVALNSEVDSITFGSSFFSLPLKREKGVMLKQK